MSFRIAGLSAEPFRHLYGMSDAELGSRGVRRHRVDEKPGFPDRIEMRDLDIGETALLLNYAHQPADTPYRSSHAIFVREGAETSYDAVDTIPEVLACRTLSLRAFDAAHMMTDADVTEGRYAHDLVVRLLKDERTAYIQAHYAKRGCYAARIERA